MKSRAAPLVLLALFCLISGCGGTPTAQTQSPAPTEGEPPPVETGLPGGEPYEITKNGLSCIFDPSSGMITQIRTKDQILSLEGILIDTGYKQQYRYNQLGYQSMDRLETWTLPAIHTRMKDKPAYAVTMIEETEEGLTVELYTGGLYTRYIYEFLPDGLRLRCELRCYDEEGQIINGVGFLTLGLGLDTALTEFEFPGNTPPGIHKLQGIVNYDVTETDYCCAVVCLSAGTEKVNIIFLDDQEKWGSGVFPDSERRACVANLAAVAGTLKKDEVMEVGTLFIQLPGGNDAYRAVQEYYTRCGYKNPENSVNDGPVYSCHPSGTMDTGFTHRKTMQVYAEQLERIAAMGMKNIWLLPVFDHPGGQVYESRDQSVIDMRYGGAEGAAVFAERAAGLGLRVLYDYVPHGPRPQEPLAQNNPDWCSKTRDGELQIEWECVSFDYNNPDYLQYTRSLVTEHALTLGVDGARIDCSMGGLPNWSPQPGYRPSSSGLAAGLNIVRAIRDGFLDAGKQPILLPENFHPIPLYAEVTDLFYDMPLYRVLNTYNYRLERGYMSDADYVRELSRWLEAERAVSVEGQQKLRFLGNHDTVSWTFDKARAQVIYGLEKSRAMFALISFIDGVPMIYQGDEAPEDYGLRGKNQEEFFSELFAARAAFIPQDYSISYLYLGTPVFAFYRFDGENRVAVLINLSDTEQTVNTVSGLGEALYSCGASFSYEASVSGNIAVLEPYGFAIAQHIG